MSGEERLLHFQGGWSPEMVGITQVMEGTTACAYMVIAVSMFILWRGRRHEAQHGWIVLLFAAFLGQCSLCHLFLALGFVLDVIPIFVASAVPRAITAAFAALVFPFVVSSWLSSPGQRSMLMSLNAEAAKVRERAAQLERERAMFRDAMRAERERADSLERVLEMERQACDPDSSIHLVRSAREKVDVLPSEKDQPPPSGDDLMMPR
jgi:hypothetical protein